MCHHRMAIRFPIKNLNLLHTYSYCVAFNLLVCRDSLLEDASDVEGDVAEVGDGSPVATAGVEVFPEGSLFHELRSSSWSSSHGGGTAAPKGSDTAQSGCCGVGTQ